MDALIDHAEAKAGLPLLRVHWYDAANQGVPDRSQQEIGMLARVKLRPGRIGFDGEQKGVDLRIGLDLVAHARNAAIDTAFLVSGDDDLTEAVEEAQAHGLQVTILAVPTVTGAAHGVSQSLLAAADDDLDLIAADGLDSAITPRKTQAQSLITASASTRHSQVPSPMALANRPRPPAQPPNETIPPAPPSSGVVFTSSTHAHPLADLVLGNTDRPATTSLTSDKVAETIERVTSHVLTTWFNGRAPDEHTELSAGRPSIPRDVDRALLRDLSDALGQYDLSDDIRYELRAHFWAEVDRRGAADTPVAATEPSQQAAETPSSAADVEPTGQVGTVRLI
ncbi:NYN domain-containing protein [Actinokineospora inagensis]|uniref:NYN domain-containing protein n=1 Tax=Actinokineospora inagensis TaxID=103730 RepID=UPI0003F8883F|nr:NYN domain-containing protein [Actinokineospora inagensis]